MNKLRVIFFIATITLGLSSLAHGANGSDFPLGYDADSKFYFFRTNKYDYSLQVGFDAGWGFYNANVQDPQNYRGVSDFDPSARQLFLGAMGEKNFFSNNLSVSAGLYYMMLTTYMFSWPMGTGSAYVVLTSNDNMVDYTLVKDVTTTSSYISIPIEGKYEFINQHKFGIYFKGALRTSFNVYSTTRFTAQPDASSQTKSMLEEHFQNDNLLFVNANAHVGMRWGGYDEANFRLELGMPIALTRNIANLHVKQGFGLRFSLFIPLSLILYN